MPQYRKKGSLQGSPNKKKVCLVHQNNSILKSWALCCILHNAHIKMKRMRGCKKQECPSCCAQRKERHWHISHLKIHITSHFKITNEMLYVFLNEKLIAAVGFVKNLKNDLSQIKMAGNVEPTSRQRKPWPQEQNITQTLKRIWAIQVMRRHSTSHSPKI